MTDLAEFVDFVVFDFDGTICESADVKTDAFYQLYLDEEGEEFAAQVRDYHLRYAGVSRFEKIKHYEEVMLGRPCTAARLEEVANRFGSIVRDKVIASPLVPGVADFFAAHGDDVPMLVASATPTEELRGIITARRINEWFEEVQGSPAPKGEIIAGYVADRAVSPRRVVMVGDQQSDIDAARYAGVHFVAYRPAGEDRVFDETVVVVDHFDALAAAIAEVVGGDS